MRGRLARLGFEPAALCSANPDAMVWLQPLDQHMEFRKRCERDPAAVRAAIIQGERGAVNERRRGGAAAEGVTARGQVVPPFGML